MDFNFKKPLHIFSLLVLLFAFFMIIISPILSYISTPSTSEDIEYTEPLLLFASIITVLIFVGVPLIWYYFVNGLSIKDMFKELQLKREKIDEALLWAVLGTILMFALIIIMGYVLMVFGENLENLSNIEDLAGTLSIVSMLSVILIQSVSEEIFFRGFLMQKVDKITGKIPAVIIVAVLFGFAHMSYGKYYPVIASMVIGLVLGFIMYKTKNLYSSIFAHLIFNFTSFMFYLFAQIMVLESLTL